MRLSCYTSVVIIVHSLVLLGIYCPLKEWAEEKRRKKKRKGKSRNEDCLLAKYLLVPPSLGF